MELSPMNVISGILILLGAGVMTVNIGKFRGLYPVLDEIPAEKGRNLRRFFSFHSMLMVFFLIGYLAVFFTMFTGVQLISSLFVSVIFFFGAIFVFLGIILESRILKALKQNYNQVVEATQTLEKEHAQLESINVQLQQEMAERLRAEKALEENEKWLSTIFENLQAGVIIIDANTHEIVQVNSLAEQLIGLSRDKIEGEICHRFICPAAVDKCPITDLNQTVDNSERKLINGRGKEIAILKTVVPMNMADKDYLIESFVDIRQLKKVEGRLKKSLAEKEILLKEIHHRVKNNLQIVSSLLHLQTRQIEDKKTLEVFKESQNRVRSMALIHEKLYASKDLAKIDFRGYAHTLIDELTRSYSINRRNLDLELQLDKIYLSMDSAIPCGLIIHELVANALKHAFPDKMEERGKLLVKMSNEQGNIRIIVQDNGVGMPESLDVSNAESLGLRLVNVLAQEQLKGKLKIDNTNGTKFQVDFESN